MDAKVDVLVGVQCRGEVQYAYEDMGPFVTALRLALEAEKRRTFSCGKTTRPAP